MTNELNRNGKPELSVVCAVYNEQENVPKLLAQFQEVVPTLPLRTELVLIDDGSKDNTLDILKSHIGKIDGLRVVQLYSNYGQVAASNAGLSVARGDWIVMMDGDLQHDPKDLGRLVAELKHGHDFVATYRDKRDESPLRLLITFVANRVNRFVTGVKVKDFGSSYRLVSARIFDMITDSRGYVHYNTPALYLYARSIVEIPIVQSARIHGSSKWTLNQFILFNLDFFLHSKKAIQVLLSLGFLGVVTGATLYCLQFTSFGPAKSVSAPITICFTSFLSMLLSIIWREVLQTQRFAMGLPDFLIAAIWHDAGDGTAAADSDAILRSGKPLTLVGQSLRMPVEK